MLSTYTVTGMTCSHCVQHVLEEVEAIPGVAGAKLALEDGVLEVTSEAPIDFAAIQAAVEEAGEYTVA